MGLMCLWSNPRQQGQSLFRVRVVEMMRITPKWKKRINDYGFKHVTRVVSASTRKHLPWIQMSLMDFHFRKGIMCCVLGGCSWKLLWNGRGSSFPVISVLENLTQTTLASYFQQITAHVLKKIYTFLTIWEVQSDCLQVAGGDIFFETGVRWWRSTLETQDVSLFLSCFFFTGFSTEEKAWLDLIWLPLFPKGWVIVLQRHFLMDEKCSHP